MAEDLGKIERPPAEDFKAGRKLYFVPLIFLPPDVEKDLAAIVDRYWAQVDRQLSNLESKLGTVSHVYHELLPVGGDEGVKALQGMNKSSHQVAVSRLERGASLDHLEDGELLAEFMDWSRCLSIGLQSPNVLNKVYDAYTEVQKKRNEHVARRLDESLKEGESGILLMREGHQVQFASDIQVFYVSPPALDEMKRWLREHEAQQRETGSSAEE